jgi:hypothetical protein
VTIFRLLVGLPGSGKTVYASNRPFLFFDDLTQNGGLDALDILPRTLEDKLILISDYGFIFDHVRQDAMSILGMKFPGCAIQWVVWENDVDQCWVNLRWRADGRKINFDALLEASRHFTYPENPLEILPVYSPDVRY